MNSFIGLVKKDIVISRFWYIVWLVLSVVVITFAWFMSRKFAEPGLVIPAFVMLIGLHVFLMPIMMGHILKIEGKTQMWLYNPQSSVKLLLAKLTALFTLQVISQLVSAVMGFFLTSYLIRTGTIQSWSTFLPFKQWALMNIGILGITLYISIWIMFLWTVYHSLGTYPFIKKFRWLVVALIIVGYNMFETLLLVKTNLIQNKLFNWSASVNVAPSIHYETNSGWQVMYHEVSLPITPIIYTIILSIILFILASRLLDKKVEV